ncbi:MAG: trypsin-like peptidase domain-containing protein [Anaerolineae bacterium]|nr:trypsin-like peptidase domain-containing protein [Phycisphaerae bacterium]
MNVRRIWIAMFCLLICTVGLADTLKLKDGTVLEGKIQEAGDKYWIKLTNGETRIVSKADVAQRIVGDAKPSAPAAPVKPGAAAPPPSPVASGAVAGTSGGFASVKMKADRVDAPIQGVQLWESFIKKSPSAGDLVAAKGELEKWEQLKKDNAEKINGKWVGGVERKRIVKQAKGMVKDGIKQIEDGQSTAGFKKFEEAIKLYPQSYEANFHLGLYYLKKSTIGRAGNLEHLDKAIKTLENAAKIAPKSSSAFSNLAIGYSFKNRHREAIIVAYKAAKMHESEGTVTNLIAAIGSAPRGTREQAWAKPIVEDAVLMTERHKVGNGGGWYYVNPAETDEIPGSDNPAGTVWSGSGFFVTDDGYLITNHHVATGEPKSPIKPEIGFRVRMDDGTEKAAELIAVDDVADIAIMKIVPDKPTVPLKLADYAPDQGAQILVLGYPATGDDEHTLEISDGSVKSIHEGDEHEIWMNLNTTHGNSGGPIVDAENNMVAILTAGRESFNMTIVLGVSTSQIKTFLGKIGDKAPKIQWAAKKPDMEKFDAVKLTAAAKVSTVCVIAVRNAE